MTPYVKTFLKVLFKKHKLAKYVMIENDETKKQNKASIDQEIIHQPTVKK